MISPFEVSSFTGFINVYAFPHELIPEDKLVDGPEDSVPFEITGNTLLIWVDLHPDAKFMHPTEYILIAPEEINGQSGDRDRGQHDKRFLYGSRNKVGVIFPFEL